MTSDIAGSEEFTKRFAVLKSQYETATKCAINVEQALKGLTLANMTKAPEIIRSMTDSLDGDVVDEKRWPWRAAVRLGNRQQQQLTVGSYAEW